MNALWTWMFVSVLGGIAWIIKRHGDERRTKQQREWSSTLRTRD